MTIKMTAHVHRNGSISECACPAFFHFLCLFGSCTSATMIRPMRNSSRLLLSRFQHTGAAKFAWPSAHLPIEAAHTPPSSWYTDPVFYEQVEKKHTFKTWLNVGRAAEVAKDGEYMALTVNDQPIIIARHDGKLRAYFNVCRHHAAQILDDGCKGQLTAGQRFVCPYHGWEYNIEGRLAKAHLLKGCQGFKASENGLKTLPVEQLGPWVYVNFGSPDIPLTAAQPDLAKVSAMLDDSGYADLVHLTSKDYILNCNWKIFLDNYLDGGYHVAIAHKSLSANLNLEAYCRSRLDGFYLQTCPAKESSERLGTEGRCKEALYVFQHPNVCINRYGQWMDTNIVFPLSVDKCLVKFDWFVHPSLLGAKSIEQSLADSELVQQEDISLCERVHRGVRSDGYDAGRYAPSLEEGEYLFHQRLYQDLLASQK